MEIQPILEEIGLTKSEIKVYLALLELGSSTTGAIVDKSGASSSKIYEILEKLVQKGLVSYIIQAGTKYFEAADPERILDYVKEKRDAIEKQEKDIEKLLPELKLKKTLSKYKSQATIFKGMKGAETAFEDILKTLKKGDEYYVLGVSIISDSFRRFMLKFHKKRAKMGVKVKMLFNEQAKELGEERAKIPLTKIKYLPKEMFTPAAINVYANKTLIAVGTEELTFVLIESNEVADSFRAQFEGLWKQETMVVKGVDAIQNIVEEILDYDEVDFIGARGYFVDVMPDYIKEWQKKAIKKGFKMRNIVDIETKGHAITNFSFAQTKYTLPKEFSKLSVFWIYGNKVVISNWVEKEPIAFIMENKHLHDMYKEQFEALWNQRVTSVTGYKDVMNLFTSLMEELGEGGEYYTIGATFGYEITGKLRDEFFIPFHKKRLKMGVKAKLLAVRDYGKDIMRNIAIAGDPEAKLSELRFMRKEFKSPAAIVIYKNKVAIFLWKKEPIAILISDKAVRDSFKLYFDALWQNAEKE